MNFEIYDKIIDIQKNRLIEEFKKKYKNDDIDDYIEESVNKILESDIDFSKINKNYKKEIPKMIREKGRVNPDKCLARRLYGGYGGQCTCYRINDTDYCRRHQTEDSRWCGLITEDRQEIFYLINDKGIHPHRWKD